METQQQHADSCLAERPVGYWFLVQTHVRVGLPELRGRQQELDHTFSPVCPELREQASSGMGQTGFGKAAQARSGFVSARVQEDCLASISGLAGALQAVVTGRMLSVDLEAVASFLAGE